MGSPLSRERLNCFLGGRLLARVALVTPEHLPYVVPIWYHWDGAVLWFVGRQRSEWCSIAAASPQAAAVIDAEGDYETGGQRFFTPRVTFRGGAQIVERPGEGYSWVGISRLMAKRYRGQAGLDYLESTRSEPRWLIKLEPSQITSWEGGGWAARYRSGAR